MIKPLRKLPTLTDSQEWACEGGCSHIHPKLFENAYALKWDTQGNLEEKKAEYYYTCQRGHLLEVWCNTEGDTIQLDDRFYEEVEFKRDLPLEYVDAAISELEQQVEKYKNMSPELSEMFSGVEVSLVLTFKNREEVSIYLEDFKAMRDRLTMPEQVYVME